MKRVLFGGAVALFSLGGVATAGPSDAADAGGIRLEAPTPVLAAGEKIDVAIGHAAPYVTDWNEDGKPDLLVGQFGSGHLTIYLNEGEANAPRFGEGTLFEAGGATASVPVG